MRGPNPARRPTPPLANSPLVPAGDCVSILPSLMRAKQWLIVGDSRQVSPSVRSVPPYPGTHTRHPRPRLLICHLQESFVSEASLSNLRAGLPETNFFKTEMLPGQSFFELASQAFPTNRVVLNEHYRCAEDIIVRGERSERKRERKTAYNARRSGATASSTGASSRPSGSRFLRSAWIRPWWTCSCRTGSRWAR